MIVDSSALVAILKGEPEVEAFVAAISEAKSCSMSAATFLETAIVIDADKNPRESAKLDEFIAGSSMKILAVTESQAKIARQAYRDFGRGSGHPARLNFGDCLAYALAKEMGEPLLYKGDDFRKTDIRAAQ